MKRLESAHIKEQLISPVRKLEEVDLSRFSISNVIAYIPDPEKPHSSKKLIGDLILHLNNGYSILCSGIEITLPRESHVDLLPKEKGKYEIRHSLVY
ncbi:hypothetical protein LDC_0036 [sediment metagenome]|uniref:Uncharacterized protein n=1 Tax=sediment metagenome TaxID=749907 RepID=D9PEV8_9ZZZZ